MKFSSIFNDNFTSLVIVAMVSFTLYNMSSKISELISHSPNQEMYLRKISDRLEWLKDHFDDAPSCNIGDWEYDYIKEHGNEAEFKMDCYLMQLRLFRTGRVRTGIAAMITPKCLCSKEENDFDAYNYTIEHYYAKKYYTKEELEDLRTWALVDRSSRFVESECKAKIAAQMNDIIKKVIAKEVVSRNNYVVPVRSMSSEIKQYFDRYKKVSSSSYGNDSPDEIKLKKLTERFFTKFGNFHNKSDIYQFGLQEHECCELKKMIIDAFMPTKSQ